MKKHRVTFLVLVAVGALCALFPAAAQARLTGAVWTTLCDGTAVDHNVYDAKEHVYLNAGPFHESGAWVPDGDYYFMVTDPPGKTLLSQDLIDNRMIEIVNGKVLVPNPVPPYTNHLWCPDTKRPGNVTIQLMPYADSKNGEYKLWLTPVDCYDLSDPGAKFGFIPSCSKTDNFRVRRGRAMIFGHKWFDDDGDGIWDPLEVPLNDWQITLYKQNKQGNWVQPSSNTTSLTDFGEGSYVFFVSEAAKYKIVETVKPGWTQTAPLDQVIVPNTIYADDLVWYVTVTKADLSARAQLGPFDFGNDDILVRRARLTGVKYNDLNRNCTSDLGEPSLPGWCVLITPGHFDPGGNFVPDLPQIKACTNGTGEWAADVPRGYVFQVCEELEGGWDQTAPCDVVLSPNVWAEDLCWYVVVPEQEPPGGDDPYYLALDFGNASCGRIIVFKFEDLDQNGIYDGADEWPISGWYIFLYDSAGNILEWAPTDPDGYVEFPTDPNACLPYGCYVVGEFSMPDWICTTCTVGNWGLEACIDAQNPAVTVEFGNYYNPCITP